MLERMKGEDIVSTIGGITTLNAAMDLFASKMDEKQLARLKDDLVSNSKNTS